MQRVFNKKKISLFSLLVCTLFLSGTLYAENKNEPVSLREKLLALQGVTEVDSLGSEHYSEKFAVRLEQFLDPKNPAAGTFRQRIIVCHAGYDRPTVLVTEGYGAAYALDPRYREELSELLDANVVFVEYRYFLESTPEPLNWDYLTAENSAYDLHRVNQTFRSLYPDKWISTGISKGGQTTLLYRAFFPDDVDFSVPYVAPLNRGVEDGRHEPFLRRVGTKKERKAIENFQLKVLKRKPEIIPLLEEFCREKQLRFRIPLGEVLDYCVLEYPFALWQWGTPVRNIPSLTACTKDLFDHLIRISSPDYFAEDQPNLSFFVQAARELGYYGYDTKPFRRYLTIESAEGYLDRIMLPRELVGKIPFDPALYHKIYAFLRDNDPKMICIYGENDPWTATHVPVFKGKVNLQVYFQPGGSHLARIGTLPEKMKRRIMEQMRKWLEEE